MADQKVKIMQLTEGTSDNTDYIPFVDVSDTTQSPNWTTKRALKSDLKWDTGNGISSVVLTWTVWLVKTYRITFTDATFFDYDVTDWEDGTDWTDGRSIVSIARTSWDWSPWTTDTYTITYDIAPLTSTFDVYNGADGTGSGDVIWPSSSTDNAIARYDSTTGKLLQDSWVTIDDSSNLSGALISLALNGLSGTTAQFNTALSDWTFATGGWTATGTNTGDQDISGIATNASAITDIEAKTDFITVTQAVDLDTIESDTADNTSNRNLVKVSDNDTTGGVLNGKLVAGANISFVEWNDWGDETLTISSTGWTWDTITTTVNTIKKDSTAWTSSTKWTLTWAIDGVNTTYTVSSWIYASWSLTVLRNGKPLIEGTWEDYVETTPWSGTFDFNTAPNTSDTETISVEYSDQDVTSSALIVQKDTTTVTTNYTGLVTDRNILSDAIWGVITITLPATWLIDDIGLRIKKIDSSWNEVIIETPWSETIDNDPDYTLSTPDEDITIITDGTNYFTIWN